MEVAVVVRDARRREELLRSRIDTLERAEPQVIERPADEDGLAEALGAETVKVLQAAREAARELIAKGERRATALVADAESALAERTRYAEEEAQALMARTRAEAAEILDSTRSQARSMVEDARDARRRILTDLATRRRALHLQLEQLQAGRVTLSGVLDGVSESVLAAVETVRVRVEGAEEEARRAAIAASATPLPSDDDLEIDEPPMIPEPSISTELATALSGAERELSPVPPRRTTERASAAVEDVRDRPEKTQGIDELFARIRESRQLEVAETRAQIEAVERELFAPAVAPEPLRPPPMVRATTSDAESVGGAAREDGMLFSNSVEVTREVTVVVTESESVRPAFAPEVATDEADVVFEAAEAERSSDGGTAEAAPTPFDLRDQMLAPAAGELGRALKRALRLEQNELLDSARNLKRTQSSRDLLPTEQMAGRVAQSVIAGLEGAWRAGESFVSITLGEGEITSSLDTEAMTEITEISRQLAVEIIEPLRRRMEAALNNAGEDAAIRTDAVNTGFRDWRASRLDEVADDYSHRVFARGVVSSSRARGVKVAWLVDDGDMSCPDCDDNALSGPTIAGSLFPTGHSHPPIHPACHCVLTPIRG